MMCLERCATRRRMRAGNPLLAGLLLVLLLVLPPAWALPPELAQRAQVLPEAERALLARRYAALQAMPADERAALHERARAWDALPLAERRARRTAWQAWSRLPAIERARMRAAAGGYAALPAQEREALADAFAALDESGRAGWLLGPGLGADWPQLHPLFALVPAAQQEELLTVLLDLDERERADLALLARRTPPEEREALRSALLSTAPANRAAWLRNRAGP